DAPAQLGSAYSRCGPGSRVGGGPPTRIPVGSARGRGLLVSRELALELGDLCIDLVLLLLVTSFAELLSRVCARLALGLLGRGDLGLDLEHGSSHHGPAQSSHGRVDDIGALLLDVCEQAWRTDLDRLRDLAERRLGLVDVVQIPQRANQYTRRSAEDHAERSPDDPDQETDDPSGRRSDGTIVLNLILCDDFPVLAAGDHGSASELELPLRVELF